MPDTPLTDQQLAERIAEVIRPRMLIGLQDAELYDAPGTERINDWADSISRWAAEAMQPELDRLRAELAERTQLLVDESSERERAQAERDQARAAAFREAARLLEDTGRDDDAVNLLDNVADGITAHAAAGES